ncbi:MAG: hypothetical protein J7474_12720, partial [Arthrobacter sp.]|nr:hypothetical protein [Arthrobacter sp.]
MESTDISFSSRDSVTGQLRGLTADEMETVLPTIGTGSSQINYSLQQAFELAGNLQINTMRLESGSSIAGPGASNASYGLYGNTGGLLTLSLTTGGIIAFAGNTGINVGALAATAAPYYFWAPSADSTLDITGHLISAQSLTFSGFGTMTLNSQAYHTGQTTVNNGTLILNGGDNTLLVNATASTPTLPALAINGGTVELNGNNQAVGSLFSNSPVPGAGGTIRNSASNMVTLTSVTQGTTTYSGVIGGNLHFSKYGNATLTLTGENTYSGDTIVGANTLVLRDGGSLKNTSSVTLNYAGLQLDQSGNNAANNLLPNLLPTDSSGIITAPLFMRGGVLTLTGAGSQDWTQEFASVSALAGQNSIVLQPLVNQGSTVKLIIDDLLRDPASQST